MELLCLHSKHHNIICLSNESGSDGEQPNSFMYYYFVCCIYTLLRNHIIYLFIYLFYKPYLLFCIQQLQSDVEFDSFKIAAYKQMLKEVSYPTHNVFF
jgi:hypothetical protein